MGDEEEDEDVVFEGSAIHQHLLDVGYTHTDFEQTTYLSPPPAAAGWDTSTHHASTTTTTTTTTSTTTSTTSTTTSQTRVQWYSFRSVAEVVAGSRCVNEDDWLVLEHFLPEGEKLRAAATTTTTTTTTTAAAAFPWHAVLTWREAAVIVPSLVVLWLVTEDLAIQASLLAVALTTYTLYWLCWLRQVCGVRRLVRSVTAATRLTARTVRLLQEMDLIAKGFVLAQGPGGSSLAPVYEESPQACCLREAMLCTLTALAEVLASSHSALLPALPHYPLIRQLFDDPPPPQQNWTPSQHMHYLKSRVTVTKLQTSAVLTELLLWLHGRPGDMNNNDAIVDIVTSFDKANTFTQKVESLRKQYEYNKSFWLTERPAVDAPQSVEEKKKNVYLAVHSLGLHLQAALVRVQDLEAKFERESDTSVLCDPESVEDFPSYEHFKTQVTALRLELDSCRGCIEEAEVRAERKYGISGDRSSAARAGVQETSEEDEHTVDDLTRLPAAAVLLHHHQVAPIEDEVFEAYVEDKLEGDRRSGPGGDDDLWCVDARQEKRMLRRQKEQGKRVLRELQPILTSRRRMWEEREKVAQEKHTCKGKLNTLQIVSNTEQEGEGEDGTDDQDTTESVNIEQLKLSGLRGGSVRCESEAPPPPPALRQPIVVTRLGDLEDEEDSDEERLRAYRKVKQELDEGEEKEERKVEEDSDEERLRVYRKVKQELDEDEEQRKAEEERVSQFGANMKTIFSNIGRRKGLEIDDQDSDSEEEAAGTFVPPLANNKPFLSLMQNSEILTENVGESDEELEGQNIENVNHSQRNNERKSLDPEVFEAFPSGDEEMTRNLSSEANTKDEEETFTHNDDIDDDNSRRIDWTTFRLPTHHTDTLDDRLSLYCGGGGLGFQAEVAAQATAASRNFWMAQKQPEETFGGVGEGEEFGNSDVESDSDSDGEN